MAFIFRHKIWLLVVACCLPACWLTAMEQHWIDDLNARFPKLGDEFQQAVMQKLAQYPPETSIEDVIAKLTVHADYGSGHITDTKSFGVHSELMILYPAIGQYENALREAQLLRDFVVANPPDNQDVVMTFRGVYAELLIVNERYAEALQECAESQALAPEEEGMYLSQGVIAIHTDNLAHALENIGILVQAPDKKEYAQQLFDFLMLHRHRFQTAQIQANTMIDVMLRDLAPEQKRTPIKISIPPLGPPSESAAPALQPTATPTLQPATPPSARERIQEPEGDDPLAIVLTASPERQAQLLGTPVSEAFTETTSTQDFQYNGQTLTITRDRQTQQILSCSMFFLPPVSEIEAFSHIGVYWRNLLPTLLTNAVKTWMPYGPFTKVRISLNQQDVLAIVVQP